MAFVVGTQVRSTVRVDGQFVNGRIICRLKSHRGTQAARVMIDNPIVARYAVFKLTDLVEEAR